MYPCQRTFTGRRLSLSSRLTRTGGTSAGAIVGVVLHHFCEPRNFPVARCSLGIIPCLPTLELVRGIEPPTCGVQNRRSTVELRKQIPAALGLITDPRASRLNKPHTNPASRASSTACGVCAGGGTRTHDQGYSTAIPFHPEKLYQLSYPGIMPVSPGCPSVYSDCRVVRRHTLRRSFFLQGF